MIVLLRIFGALMVLAGLWGLVYGLIVLDLRAALGGVFAAIAGVLFIAAT